jgi:hypothetical protein
VTTDAEPELEAQGDCEDCDDEADDVAVGVPPGDADEEPDELPEGASTTAIPDLDL